MYQYENKELTITCEVISESQEGAAIDSEGGIVEVSSEYLVKLRNTIENRDYEILIQMEGTPGVAAAIFQTLRHMDLCTRWPLDMLARVNVQDIDRLLRRLTELKVMIHMAYGCNFLLIQEGLKKLPEWDLENGRYAIMETADNSDYSEDEYDE